MTWVELLGIFSISVIILLSMIFTEKFLSVFKKSYCIVVASIFSLSILHDLSSKGMITEMTNLKIVVVAVSVLLIFISIEIRRK